MTTTGIILLSIAAVIVIALSAAFIILKIRARRFRPTEDKAAAQEALNRDLSEAGFAYDRRGDIFYSLMDCWQREMGYCQLYDEGSSLFNMVMHCEPVRFSYAGKRWMIELWKGQYGITTGAEVGIYNTDQDDIRTERFTGPFYDCAQDSERLPLSFVLRKNGRVLFKRKALHWWLTGFRLGEFSTPDSLTMDVRIRFPDHGMRDAFLEGLLDLGYGSREYAVHGDTVTVHYTKPHSVQPLSHGSLQEAAVQQVNKSNCALYMHATAKYKDTLDKLEYIKALVPELYEFCMHSLYARGFYEGFEWLLDLIHKHSQEPKPIPPAPHPPRPCQPKPCQPKPCPSKPCRPDPCGSSSCHSHRPERSCRPDSCSSGCCSSHRAELCCHARRANRLCRGNCEDCPYRRTSGRTNVSAARFSSCCFPCSSGIHRSGGSCQHMSLSCPGPGRCAAGSRSDGGSSGGRSSGSHSSGSRSSGDNSSDGQADYCRTDREGRR